MDDTGTGREYLRVSQDRSGRARSPEEQHDDNKRAAAGHGITITGEPYSDVSLSASGYATKVRGDFARLRADLRTGQFGAGALVLWESSRGSRQVEEWAGLVKELKAAGVKVFVTTHNRLYDCRNARDRRTLFEDAVDAEYASDKASEAIRRAAAATAARGEPHGRIPYGYRRTYDQHTRKLIGQEPDPAEAPVVAELLTRLRQGHSLKAIARDFEERGIRTRTGKVFTPQHLRDMAIRPVYAGLRVHEPGSRHGSKGNLDGATEATWPPLVDRETFYTVRRMLDDPARRVARDGRAQHLLSFIARCHCGSPLTASYRTSTRLREYACRDGGHVRVGADDLDGYAEQVMLAYLARPDVIGGLRARPSDDGELGQLRGRLAQARAELEQLRAAARAGKVTVATLLAVEPGLAGRVETLEAAERDLLTPPPLSVIPPGADVAARWAAAPVSARRQVARLLCSGPVLGVLTVLPAPSPGHRGEVAERTEWRRDGVSERVARDLGQ